MSFDLYPVNGPQRTMFMTTFNVHYVGQVRKKPDVIVINCTLRRSYCSTIFIEFCCEHDVLLTFWKPGKRHFSQHPRPTSSRSYTNCCTNKNNFKLIISKDTQNRISCFVCHRLAQKVRETIKISFRFYKSPSKMFVVNNFLYIAFRWQVNNSQQMMWVNVRLSTDL